MTLQEYINSFPKKERLSIRKRIARFLHVSEIYVRSMCNGNKKIPEKLAVDIELATEGNVKREEICPRLYASYSTLKKNYNQQTLTKS